MRPADARLPGVYHYQQFHQVVVDRGADGLDDKYVPLPDVFQDAHKGVVVGELEHLRLAVRDAQVLADRVGQLPGERSRKTLPARREC